MPAANRIPHTQALSRLPSPTANLNQPSSFVRSRKQDYENYLCILFFPRHLQPAQYALRAFNAEIASVRESVSDPIIGKMRMQFWKNTIDQVFAKKPPQQPIAIALTSALETCSLSSLWFKRIITERESNFEDPQYMTIKDVETYAENTASALLYLQLESLGVRDVSVDHAASHLGKAIGIATLLRALPFHASRRRLVLPAQVTAKVCSFVMTHDETMH
ncbi:Squalene/phytoene synthase-domain-containing protein [Endogone sp. FLAS-F59071]|nr:Squalene/phytoene synthase-domain-containing protein [Endogone sp. FLAS-F59071]|eukprot:RUS16155.1 Squalene/phytoene synthase-domain-containing protein [Endogone sp. FLAS-F59071]